MDVALLVLRVALGLTIAAHGAQKLFGWFGGYGLKGTAGFFETLGFRPGALYARMSVLAEFGGGLLIAFGFLSPLGAAGVIGSMVAAIATFHWAKGFFNENGGYEFNLLVAITAFAIALGGPGAISVDSALGWDISGTGWGVAAAVTGVATAAGVMARRREAAAPEAAGQPAVEESRAA